jgi:6-pyruvoyltetrahydropterin/6-carboxytetrahydropterin synthase
MIIFRQFTFDSAHFLSKVPVTHKCREIHGHTYHLKIFLDGPLDEEMGWVMDFAEVKQVVGPVVDMLDHKMLNNIPGLENPTCELVAVWIWNKIKPGLPLLCRIELNETPTSGAVYMG